MLSPFSVGWDQSVTIGPPSKRWQGQRKLLHQFLGAPSIPLYHDMIDEGAREFVLRVLPTQEGFMDHFLLYVVPANPTYGMPNSLLSVIS